VGNERSEAKGAAATEKSPSFRQKQKHRKVLFVLSPSFQRKMQGNRPAFFLYFAVFLIYPKIITN